MEQKILSPKNDVVFKTLFTLYYWSKLYSSNLKIGNDYEKLRKTISIIIVGEKIKEFKHINKSHTKWEIVEENRKDVLTQDLEIHIIELPKAIQEYKNNPHDELLQWMMFLENPEDAEVSKIMENNENIKEAKEELEKISTDELLERMALRAEIDRLDRNQFAKDAREEGIQEERERAKKEKIEIAKRLLITGMSKQQVCEIMQINPNEL